jgi:hypothetical protein
MFIDQHQPDARNFEYLDLRTEFQSPAVAIRAAIDSAIRRPALRTANATTTVAVSSIRSRDLLLIISDLSINPRPTIPKARTRSAPRGRLSSDNLASFVDKKCYRGYQNATFRHGAPTWPLLKTSYSRSRPPRSSKTRQRSRLEDICASLSFPTRLICRKNATNSGEQRPHSWCGR